MICLALAANRSVFIDFCTHAGSGEIVTMSDVRQLPSGRTGKAGSIKLMKHTLMFVKRYTHSCLPYL